MAPRSFLAVALSGGRELGHRAARGRLGGLTAGIRVDLGVEDEDVDVAARRQDLVDAAEPDVVRPAVAADDPDALANEVARQREQVARVGCRRSPSIRTERVAQEVDRARAGATISGFGVLRRRRGPLARAPSPISGASRSTRRRAWSRLGVEGEAHPEPELGVVLEQRVAPRRATARGVDGPWRGRQVGAVDRRAAGRVGDDHAVAEQLADEPDVGRLAASAARAGELEQRLQDLAALDRVVRDQARGRAAGSTGRSPSGTRSTSRCSATGSMLIALWLESVLLFAGQTSTQTPQPVQSSGATWIVEPVIEQVARPELLVARSRPARRRGRRSGTPSSGSWRAGRPSRTCRSRCRSTDPRSGSSGRSPASRTGSCPSGTCRRPAAR